MIDLALNDPITVAGMTITPRDDRFIDVSKGSRSVTIDTDDMTREDVSRALMVAADMLDRPPNRRARRARKGLH